MSNPDPVRSTYCDSSLIVAALMAGDPRHGAARRLLTAAQQRVSSVVAEVEVLRALGRQRAGTAIRAEAARLLETFDLIELSPDVRDAAAKLEPTALRTLDAIHVASARAAEADTFQTLDGRQQLAAEEAGLRVNPR